MTEMITGPEHEFLYLKRVLYRMNLAIENLMKQKTKKIKSKPKPYDRRTGGTFKLEGNANNNASVSPKKVSSAESPSPNKDNNDDG